jgi:uncharacterized protein YukE
MAQNVRKYSIQELITLSSDMSGLCRHIQDTLELIHQQAESLELNWCGEVADTYQESMRGLKQADANNTVVELSDITRRVLVAASALAGEDKSIGMMIADLPTGMAANTITPLSS